MVYLQIEGDRIPVGNFSFIYDYTKNEGKRQTTRLG